jgi:2-iminobutanoate/2-iminopropanoate deaminase
MQKVELIEVPDTLHLGKFMNAPASPAAKGAGLIFTGGYISFDPKTGQAKKGTIEEETIQTLLNIEQVLIAGGSSLEKVLKVNIFIDDLNEWERMNVAYCSVFRTHTPARRTVQAKMVGGFKVEIEAIALA